MDNKQYALALILGRFQVFHNGHVEIVNKALEERIDRIIKNMLKNFLF